MPSLRHPQARQRRGEDLNPTIMNNEGNQVGSARRHLQQPQQWRQQLVEQQTQELQILLALYQTTNGSGSSNTTAWTSSKGWLEQGVIPCDWEGVVCNDDNLVTALNFPRNNLMGTLPASMLWNHMQFLSTVDVSGNPDLIVDFEEQVLVSFSSATTPSSPSLFHDASEAIVTISKRQDNTDSTLYASSSATTTAKAPVRELNISHTATVNLQGVALDLSETLQIFDISKTQVARSDNTPSNLLQLHQLTHLSMNNLVSNATTHNSNNNEDLIEIDYNNSLSSVLQEAALVATTVDSEPKGVTWRHLQAWYASHAGLTGTLPPRRIFPKIQTIDWSHNRLSGTIPSNFLWSLEDVESNTNSSAKYTLHLQSNQLTGALPPSPMSPYQQTSNNIWLDVTDNLITNLPSEFCNQTEWMDGAVGQYGCDALLCPPGYYNHEYGRQISNTAPCRMCPNDTETHFYGSMQCDAVINDDNIDNNATILLANEEMPVMATESEISMQIVALTEFYEATGGEAWTRSDGWLETKDGDGINNGGGICQWYGVSCEDGLVRELNLPSNNIQGRTPPSLLLLSSLRRLILLDNPELVLDLPTGSNYADAWPDLQGLILSRTGTESLAGIATVAPNLFLLDVNSARISGSTISDVFSLRRLRTLNVGNNVIDVSLPSTLGDLTNLVSLRASNASLFGPIPTALGQMTKLVVLELSENSFEGPLRSESLNPLRDLRILDLHGQKTSLGGPVPALDGLISLLQIDLSSCALTGSIPSAFLQSTGDKSRSMDVNLRANQLTGSLPAELLIFESLNFDITENQLVALPEAFCMKTGWMFGLVEDFGCDAILCPSMSYNKNGRQISTADPCTECLYPADTMPYLGSVECPEIASEETITESPTETPSARASVTESPTIAPTPNTNVDLTQREILTLLFEKTGGPSSWLQKENWLDDTKDICSWYGVRCGNDFQVRSLVLSRNGLRQKTPAELFRLRQLERLYLDGNTDLLVDLSGMNSTEKSRLRALDISNTATSLITGISAASSLQVLDLSLTNISGDALDEIVALAELQSLNIGNTRLDRALPEIGELVELRELVAPRSGITGIVPESLGQLSRLAVLDLSANKLSGSLPLSLEELRDIRILNLSNQDVASGGGIRGRIPALSKHRSLSKVDLSSNLLAGEIPEDFLAGIFDKSATMDVNLGNNLLRGSVPESLGSFRVLNFDVTANLISDLSESLCAKELWMNGNTVDFGCDAILCPPNSFNAYGRQLSEAEPCEPCLGEPQPFFGSTLCSDSSSQTQNSTTICPDGNLCYNAGICAKDLESENGSFTCDCSGKTAAGISCTYKATNYCHENGFLLEDNITSFCTNNGSCKEIIAPGAEHQGCECNFELWEGEYCEIKKNVSTPTPSQIAGIQTCPDGHICQNGGQCIRILSSVGSYTCDCSDAGGGQSPFAGSQCQYSATSMCSINPPYNSFCVNGGACQSLVDGGSEHSSCTCPDGFAGKHCQIAQPTTTAIDGSENSFVVPPSSDDAGMEGWRMALVFVLPALAIVAIIALIIAGYSRKKKANLKFVDADYLVDSEYDKYKSENPGTPRNLVHLRHDEDVSDFETPSSIIDRALLSTPDEPLTNGTAYFSLPDLQRPKNEAVYMSDDEEENGKIRPAQLFNSPESCTSSVTRSSEMEDSPVELADSATLDKNPGKTTHDDISKARPFNAGAEAPTSAALASREVAHETQSKSVRIDETPNIVTWEKQEEDAAEKRSEILPDENTSERDEKESALELSDIQEEEEEFGDNGSVKLLDIGDYESSFIGDIFDPTSANGNALAVGRSLFSGIQNDDSVSFLESSVAMSDESERSVVSNSDLPRVQVSVAPGIAESMFGGREASDTSSGELSLNF